MNDYLNKDMNEAIDQMEMDEVDKNVIRQILMIEKREKNNAAAKNEIVDADITLIEQNYDHNLKGQL